MSDRVPAVQSLMTLLQFGAQDLQANHEERLGDQQRQRLQHLQRRALMVGALGFLAFAIAASVCLFIGTENGHLIMFLLGMFLTMVNALYVGIFARQWLRLQADLRAGTVIRTQGELERVVKANGRMNNFLIRIADETFYVNKDIFLLFGHEMPYAVYHSPYSHVLLAAEPLEEG